MNRSDPEGALTPIGIGAGIACTALAGYSAYSSYQDVKDLANQLEDMRKRITEIESRNTDICAEDMAEVEELKRAYSALGREKLSSTLRGSAQSIGIEIIWGIPPRYTKCCPAQLA